MTGPREPLTKLWYTVFPFKSPEAKQADKHWSAAFNFPFAIVSSYRGQKRAAISSHASHNEIEVASRDRS